MTEIEKHQLYSRAVSAKKIKISTMVSGDNLIDLLDENAALKEQNARLVAMLEKLE